jgi:hypothetical protein
MLPLRNVARHQTFDGFVGVEKPVGAQKKREPDGNGERGENE